MKIVTIIGLAATAVAAPTAVWIARTTPTAGTSSTIQRAKFSSGSSYVVLEFLDDDLLHFEVSGVGPGPAESAALSFTPEVFKQDYAGPQSFTRTGNTMETAELRVSVSDGTLCMSVTDKARNHPLTTICPSALGQPAQRLTLSSQGMQNAYGLGEQFGTPGEMDGDWIGRVRTPGDAFGNQMTGYNGGATGNAQFPVLFSIGQAGVNYALFLDHPYKMTWSFNADPWTVDTAGDAIRGFIMAGADLPDLRQDYMELVGRPLVPPKPLFGLWVSEYGYDDWAELESKLSTLRQNQFPIDGFVLDLQWFGGITANSDDSNMGRVSWDPVKFPNAAAKLASYKSAEGIGVIPIEESYVARARPEHEDLKARGFLVRSSAGADPVYLTANPWWGKGGMIDWTQDTAGDYWHDLKREPLIDAGVMGHWIDLGEPEQYSSSDWVSGALPGKHQHADYHNLYSFKWAESIARGYARNGAQRRPFMMARSGAPGIQRFGAAMWSGDIGGNLSSLAAHINVQMQMSMSGIDYFGSDVAGFHRGAIDGDLNDVYTQWFANSMWFDVPGRPHTENLCNCRETAPDRVGLRASNLANVRQRYELVPYLYSLAHRAYRFGEPVAPPLVYYYQADPKVRRMGSEKLIGRDLLVAAVAKPGATVRDVYLPAGDWVNYNTGEWFHSQGQTYQAQPLIIDGVFRVPAYARAGAILPKAYVDDKSQNTLGKRSDGSVRNELIARVYTASPASSFDLYEDDGETIAYTNGAFAKTSVTQDLQANSETVVIGAAAGSYAGAPASRNNVVELVTDGLSATAVTLNGAALSQLGSQSALDGAVTGWFNAGNGMIVAKSGPVDLSTAKQFVFSLRAEPRVSAQFICDAGTTVPGQSVYALGNVPALGNWQAQNAVKLEPNGPYPRWTQTIANLPPSSSLEWKCIKRLESGDTSSVLLWQPGPNNVLVTPASGNAGSTRGSFQAPGANTSVSVKFICDAGTTSPGQSVYVVGNAPELGSWQPRNAVKLEPNGPSPRWTGTLSLPANTAIEWKCIERNETGEIDTVLKWEPGENNQLTIPGSGSAQTLGSFSG